MSRAMGTNDLPTLTQVTKIFEYEVITPLTQENTDKITKILNRNDIRMMPATGIMGTLYYGIKDSDNKMLCFAESEQFDRPCKSYRICLGDYRANADKSVEIANLNCWYKLVPASAKVKTARKKVQEKRILEMYERIRLWPTQQKNK